MPLKSRGKANALIVQTARNLRRDMTPAEKRLWAALRGRRLAGLKFRRQHPLDRFILDFYCAEHRLVVEVDGAIHSSLDQLSIDQERTKWLNERGVRVIRFKNDEVMNHLDNVLKKIEATISPSPNDIISSLGEGAGG